MPFTDAAREQASIVASHSVWDSWHDPRCPPRVYCQPDDALTLLAAGEDPDPATNPGHDVSDDFTAHYDPAAGQWTFTAVRDTFATHALTKTSWLAGTYGPGHPQSFSRGETLTFTWRGTRDDCVTVTG